MMPVAETLISIHAPREGSDERANRYKGAQLKFLSTLPVRGATEKSPTLKASQKISIHAPREGSDR